MKATSDIVYGLITDIGRMGEWSPECYRCEWVDVHGAAVVGARFQAWNRKGRLRWSNMPEVIAAVPGREFAFRRVAVGAGEVIWRYRIDSTDVGVVLTESYEIVRPSRLLVRLSLYLLAGVRNRPDELRQGMTMTLARIEAAAEARS